MHHIIRSIDKNKTKFRIVNTIEDYEENSQYYQDNIWALNKGQREIIYGIVNKDFWDGFMEEYHE